MFQASTLNGFGFFYSKANGMSGASLAFIEIYVILLITIKTERNPQKI